jgi:hypothetical protein
MEWRELHWPRPLSTPAALGLLRALAADDHRGPLIWEARAEAGHTRYLLGAEGTDLSGTLTLIRRLIPDVAITDLTAPRAEVERAGRVQIRRPNLNLSLETSDESLRALLAALSGATGKDDVLVVQVVLGRGHAPEILPPNAADPSTSWVDLLTTGPKKATSSSRARLEGKLAQYRFRAVARVGISSASPVRRRLLVHAALAALRTLQSSGTTISLTSKKPENLDAARVPLRQPLRLTPEEALALLAWPVGEADLPGLPPAHPRLIPPPKTYRAPRERVFALSTAPGPETCVGIGIEDSLRHTHIYGPTGSGKSTLMLHLIAADIQAGRSVVVIDPKRDLGTDVLTLVPEDRHGDVVVIDPTLPNPVGINPFANAGEDAALVADNVLAIFKGLFPSEFGPLTSDTLHASLLTLAANPGSALTDLPSLLTDPTYRRSALRAVDDPVLQGFWAQFDAKSSGQQAAAVSPVLTRLRQFILRPGLRAVVDQSEPRFALEDIVTKPRIVVVTLNKGVLGPKAAELLGSLVVSQLWQLILRRASVPQSKRTPISIYLDEAQSFLHLDSDLGEALEQSRSLGAAWHLAHQHRAQFPDKLLKGIDANARNKIIFGLEDEHAHQAARTTGLTAEDFSRLPPYEIYTSLQNQGRRTGWFSARVLPPPKMVASADAVIAESQARYGRIQTPPVQLELPLDFRDDEPLGRRKRGSS